MTGSGGSGRGRLASLIAPVHIAVLRGAQIVRGLGAVLALLQEQHGLLIAISARVTTGFHH